MELDDDDGDVVRARLHPVERPGEDWNGIKHDKAVRMIELHPVERPGEDWNTGERASPAETTTLHPVERPGEDWNEVKGDQLMVYGGGCTRSRGRVRIGTHLAD